MQHDKEPCFLTIFFILLSTGKSVRAPVYSLRLCSRADKDQPSTVSLKRVYTPDVNDVHTDNIELHGILVRFY